jgi:hypothetical protein
MTTAVHAGQERMIAAVRLMERAITEVEAAGLEQKKARSQAAQERTATLAAKAAELAASPTVAVPKRWMLELADALHEARNNPREISRLCEMIDAAAGGGKTEAAA